MKEVFSLVLHFSLCLFSFFGCPHPSFLIVDFLERGDYSGEVTVGGKIFKWLNRAIFYGKGALMANNKFIFKSA